MNIIKIFGHKSPDTDATCAPIVWAWYLNQKEADSAAPYLLGQPNTEAQFVLKRWQFKQPALLDGLDASDRVVIVDTNNVQELPDNVNQAQIIQIIDHHKLVAGLETSGPIEITIRPLACTMSVMYELMEKDVSDLPDNIAGLMLSGILSDTLAFRSPTTTEDDIIIAKTLAAQLDINITEYAQEMFAAKSDVSHFSDEELLRLDSKKYEVGGKNLRISVLETTTPETILKRKPSLMAAMEIVAAEDEVDEVLLFVVDILKEEATLLVPNLEVKALAEASFAVTIEDDQIILPGIVSRKKQIIPELKIK